MLIKGSQRGGAKQQAHHILLGKENEHVEVYEVRGFTSDNPHVAFQEMYALSLGTECKQFMFSVSMNPPLDEDAPPEYFENAMASIEKEMELKNQPRIVVFHEKEGRRHAHCVWSRIDLLEMKAINLPFYKNKLNEISKQLYLKHGWELPKGYIDRQFSDPTNFSLEEWQQAKRAKEDPKILKRLFAQTWQASDNKQSYMQALKEYGFTLARGDQRGYVAVDYKGKFYSLSRWSGVKSKQLKERLGDPEHLPSVDEAKADIARKMTKTLDGHLQQVRGHWQTKLKPFRRVVRKMRDQHATERERLAKEQKARWQHEEKLRVLRLPKGIKGLWHRVTGKYQKIRAINEKETRQAKERDKAQKQKLIIRHLKQRQKLQKKLAKLRYDRNEAMLSLRLDMGQYLEMQEKDRPNLTDKFSKKLKDQERDDPDFDREL